MGSPTPAADRNGKSNSAVAFDGASDYDTLGTIASSLTEGSMAFWARTNSRTGSDGLHPHFPPSPRPLGNPS